MHLEPVIFFTNVLHIRQNYVTSLPRETHAMFTMNFLQTLASPRNYFSLEGTLNSFALIVTPCEILREMNERWEIVDILKSLNLHKSKNRLILKHEAFKFVSFFFFSFFPKIPLFKKKFKFQSLKSVKNFLDPPQSRKFTSLFYNDRSTLVLRFFHAIERNVSWIFIEL